MPYRTFWFWPATVRHIMVYHFEKGQTAAEGFCDLNELFSEGTIGERQVRRWFERFKSGDTSLEDEEGRGRPSNFDDQARKSMEIGWMGPV